VGSLRGKAALVTGAGKRIGREIVLALADAGVDCLVHYNRSGAEGAAVIDACRARGVRTESVAADLADSAALPRLADAAHAFGASIFVHNASTFTRLPFFENDAKAHAEMLARDLAIHVTAPYLLGRMLGEHMVEGQWGRIVLIGDWSSTAAVYRNYAPYVVSKAAVPTLAKVLALELGSRAPGVTVNAVLPGPILPPEGHDAEDFEMVKRQTDLTEKIRPPLYPFAIDRAAAQRGAPLFASNCNSCHGGPESDKRLYSVAEIGTDPHRAGMFTQKLADGFNTFLAELEAEGYRPPKEVGVRSTGKYFAATLSGVWARSPYLHNGSVPNLWELLKPAKDRTKNFMVGSRVFDPKNVGYDTEHSPFKNGSFVVDPANANGNGDGGHEYGTDLSEEERWALVEYLKTL